MNPLHAAFAAVGGVDPGAILTPVIDSVSTGVSAVAGPALLVAGGLLALTVGWKYVKKFVRS